MRPHLAAGIALLALLLPPASRAAGAQQPLDTIPLSLDDAVVRALRMGDETRVAATQVELADAQVALARAGGLPQLRVNGNYTRTFESARGQAVGSFFAQTNTYSASARFDQTIFQGGRVFAASRAASRLRRAARLTEEETRAEVQLDVVRAYLVALLADRLAEIQTTNAFLAGERLSQVERLEQGGRAARYDVLRARVERANLEPFVVQARSARELAELELKRLLDLPVEQPLRLTTRIDSASVGGILAAVEGPTLVAAGAADDGAPTGGAATAAAAGVAPQPLPDRPSIRAAELVLGARRAGVAAARADWLPTISVFAQAGYGAFPNTGFPRGSGVTSVDTIPCVYTPIDPSFRCTRSSNNGGWFSDQLAGVQFSWNLFDGFRTKANIDLAKAQERLAATMLEQERERVALEVAAARAGLRSAQAIYAARRQNATEAGEAFRLASLRFDRGLGTQLEVSDAQLAQLTAQTNEAQSIYDLYLAAAELARALGRPVPLPADSATPTPLRTTDAR
ncbi:MAG TPA: TolC family protein [Gemmatimonadaceae bacterium]